MEREHSNDIIPPGFGHEIHALDSVLEANNLPFLFVCSTSYPELDFDLFHSRETRQIPGRSTASWASWKGSVVGVMKVCLGILSCGGEFEQSFQEGRGS